MKKIILTAIAASLLSTSAHADAASRQSAVLYMTLAMHKEICSTPLPSVVTKFLEDKAGTYEQVDIAHAQKVMKNSLGLGIGPWCRVITAELKKTIME
jgi:hypothetical protein